MHWWICKGTEVCMQGRPYSILGALYSYIVRSSFRSGSETGPRQVKLSGTQKPAFMLHACSCMIMHVMGHYSYVI